MIKIQNYINGELVAPQNGLYLDSFNPATGQVHAQAPDSGRQDVDEAVQAAQNAFPDWSRCSARTRAGYLRKIADLIERQLPQLSEAESADNGKPLQLAREVDIPRAAANFRYFASAIEQFSSESHFMEGQGINYTLRRPIGVAGCISPWNLPLYLLTWKIAPALAAGNCVVAKPSEITPLTAFLLAQICREAELPAGALNIIHGRGETAGEALVRHPQVGCLSFTGGTQTGAQIAGRAAPAFKKISLELGGKNPNLIFADCNYRQMLETTLHSSFANQGQICLCGSRIYVEETLYKKFRHDFVARVKSLKVGDPLRAVHLGAVVSKAHQEKILAYIELAKQEGGAILTGGKAVRVEGRCADGWFVAPTVIEGLPNRRRANQEEIFGPVVTIQPFKSESEAVNLANQSQYGLAAILWTENLSRAHRIAERLQAGIVWVNCWMLRDLRTPFGGVKNSGVGREGGFEALRFFTEAKNVCIRY